MDYLSIDLPIDLSSHPFIYLYVYLTEQVAVGTMVTVRFDRTTITTGSTTPIPFGAGKGNKGRSSLADTCPSHPWNTKSFVK
jgi:hypothetical protein